MAEEEKDQAADDAPATESKPANDDPAGDTPRESADEAADVDVDQVPDEGAAAAPDAPDEAPATESEPAEDEPAGDTPRESADEAADVDVDQAPDPEPEQKATSSPPAAKGPPAEPQVNVPPKEKRRVARSTHTGEAGPPRTVEERITDRETARKAKAVARSRYRKGRGKARHDAIERNGGTPKPERVPGNPKVRQGIVVSDKMDKTITVRVESARRHPAYEKVIRSSKMYHAHDEANEAGPGDTVRLIETRPMSKTKHWRLTEILERAK